MSEKIDFIILFRAIASFSVMIFHFFNVSPGYFISYFSQDTNYQFIQKFYSIFNLGSFAVGLFFLISGFVIPISLEKYGAKKFIIQRFFRLYPAFLVAICLYYIFVAKGYAALTNNAYTYDFSFLRIIFAPILNQDGNFKPLDMILWTIRIEWKFYFYCTILFFILRVVASKLKHNSDILNNFSMIHLVILLFLSRDTHFIMLIFGLANFLFYTKRINHIAFILLFLLFLFVLLLKKEYQIAGLVWLSFYFLRNKIKCGKISSFFADISYTLYLIHPIGYFLYSYLVIFRNMDFIISGVIVILSCIFLAFLITEIVEKRFTLMGKKLLL